MTANLRIVPKNDWDDATLTPSATEESGFDVENTQNTIRDKAWRTTSNASQSVTAVWSASRTFSHFSMHRHLCHAGSVKLELFSDAAATVSVYDSGAVSATPYSASESYTWSEGSNNPLLTSSSYWLWFTPTAARSAKITFSGTPSQAYWQVSRIWAGRYWQPTRNFARGLNLGRGDLTDAETTQGGSLRTNESESWRVLNGELTGITATEFATLSDIYAYAGRSKDIVVSVYAGDGTRKEERYCFAGKMTALNDIGRPSVVFTSRINIREN